MHCHSFALLSVSMATACLQLSPWQHKWEGVCNWVEQLRLHHRKPRWATQDRSTCSLYLTETQNLCSPARWVTTMALFFPQRLMPDHRTSFFLEICHHDRYGTIF